MNKKLKRISKIFNLSEPTISTILGALVVIIVGALIFNYFKTTPRQEEKITEEATSDEVIFEENEKGETIPVNLPEKHTVAQGENLWKIAEKYYQSGYNWLDIASANNLANPDLLFVGQELVLPKVAVKKLAQEQKAVLAQTSANPDLENQTISGDSYVAVEGDNLWKISVRAYADGYKWVDIAKANNIVNPNFLAVGQELKIPR